MNENMSKSLKCRKGPGHSVKTTDKKDWALSYKGRDGSGKPGKRRQNGHLITNDEKVQVVEKGFTTALILRGNLLKTTYPLAKTKRQRFLSDVRELNQP
ncbi:hypothetical protein RUM43_004548 [Polyplax serrata]|uniref:Uncharacterized protein n=1 Tax=Polyplax serrata TaxID=468196 RepID=A0AAN8XM26_POLSC